MCDPVREGGHPGVEPLPLTSHPPAGGPGQHEPPVSSLEHQGSPRVSLAGVPVRPVGVGGRVSTDEQTLDTVSCPQPGQMILSVQMIVLEILSALLGSLERNIDLPAGRVHHSLRHCYCWWEDEI